MKIIIDTDLGSDVDDVWAIAYALRHPDLEVLAITSVHAHPVERAELAHHLLAAAGVGDVEVSAGLALPMSTLTPTERAAYLGTPLTHARPPQATAPAFPRGDAVRTLVDTVDAHAGDIGIVAIGPLTNVAAAIMADPDLPDKVKFIAIMGGEVNRNHKEYNVRLDPEASDLVYGCGAEVFLGTWEVTRKMVLLPHQLEVLRASGGPLCQELLRCTDAWWPFRRDKPGPVLYDVAPFLWILEPDRFTVERRAVRVETQNPELRGVTYFETKPTRPTIQVTTDIHDPDAVVEQLMRLVKD